MQIIKKIDPFLDSIKSSYTRKTYQWYLKHFLESGTKLEDMQIVEYLNQFRDKSYSYRATALAAIKHYCIMNNRKTRLNWEWISKFLGENIMENSIRGYTHEEIARLVNIANIKYKAIILTLASTGMRRAALAAVRQSDLEYLKDYRLYKITIYRKTKDEQICFTTPEAAEAINAMIQNGNTFHQRQMHAITETIRNLCEKVGLASNPGKSRHAIPAVHGLRKFCITQMARAKVDTEIAKILTGHTIGVRSHYLKYTEEDLLQEYLKAVDLLTISEENRLAMKVQQLQAKQDDLMKMRLEIADLREIIKGKG